MRALIILLVVAAPASAGRYPQGTERHFTNDTGFRWEIGEFLDVTKPSDQQSPNTDAGGPQKFYFEGIVSSGLGDFLDFWNLKIRRANHNNGTQVPRGRFLATSDQPVFAGPNLARRSGLFLSATERWEFAIEDDDFHIQVRAFGSQGRGYVHLARVGDVQHNGRTLPDYQPVGWGFRQIPEPSTVILLLAMLPAIAWRTKR